MLVCLMKGLNGTLQFFSMNAQPFKKSLKLYLVQTIVTVSVSTPTVLLEPSDHTWTSALERVLSVCRENDTHLYPMLSPSLFRILLAPFSVWERIAGLWSSGSDPGGFYFSSEYLPILVLLQEIRSSGPCAVDLVSDYAEQKNRTAKWTPFSSSQQKLPPRGTACGLREDPLSGS